MQKKIKAGTSIFLSANNNPSLKTGHMSSETAPYPCALSSTYTLASTSTFPCGSWLCRHNGTLWKAGQGATQQKLSPVLLPFHKGSVSKVHSLHSHGDRNAMKKTQLWGVSGRAEGQHWVWYLSLEQTTQKMRCLVDGIWSQLTLFLHSFLWVLLPLAFGVGWLVGWLVCL